MMVDHRKKISIALLVLACFLLPLDGTRAGVRPEVLVDQAMKMKFICVKGGCYEMGDISGDGAPEERPRHTVCVNDFYIGAHEVTQGQWRLIVGNSPSYFKEGEDFPVDTVSWDDTQEFITKLNRKTGKTYRLPTEAEWEYASRGGGVSEKWAGTNFESELGAYAWYAANSEVKTHPVGLKKANALGLYDMSGNVWEWVQDRFDKDYYEESPKDNPEGPEEGYERLLRGGSWHSTSWTLRTSYRLMVGPSYRADNTGFRLVLPIPPPPPPEVKKVTPPSPPPPKQVSSLRDIYFDFDKHIIRSYDEDTLKHNLDWFKKNPGRRVRIEGHCDERGSAKHNFVLGRGRADAVKAFLISLGVDGKLLETVSYGKEKPLDPGHDEEAWAKNRRIHFVPIE